MKRTFVVTLLLASSLVTNAQVRETRQAKVSHEDASHSGEIISFLKTNPTVDGVSWRSPEKIIVRLKNGSIQTYNLSDLDQKKNFENKYGTAPTAPPPPPPAPPVKHKHSK